MKPFDSRRGVSSVSPLAVVDVGTTAIRMAVAQVDADGAVQILDTLRQAVSLGKDTFTKGRIEADTIEECVKGLRSFGRILEEYGIPLDRRHVRAVATSAVREAANRETVLDRIYIATGLDVEVIDEAESNRFTYLALQQLLELADLPSNEEYLVIEVGGGSTDLLALRKNRVLFSQGHRLGALRLRQMLEDYRAPAVQLHEVMENQIQRTVERIRDNPLHQKRLQLVVMGGEARFAASELVPSWDKQTLLELSVALLDVFTRGILERSVDELVRMYQLTYPEAETLGPTLLTYTRLAQALKADHVYVTSITMRDGVIAEMAARSPWTGEFTDQILNSTLALGKKYHFDRRHAEHVAVCSRLLFAALEDEHQLPPRFELILTVAALLHDVGTFVSNRHHHLHSMYLVANAEVFGLGMNDLLLAALVARYHRRDAPRATDEGYAGLNRDLRIAVSKLAAILRVADALDRSHTQRVRAPEIAFSDGQLSITVPNVPDLTLEQLALEHKGNMFEQVYGAGVVLKRGIARD